MSGILPDQDTTADNTDENVDWHWRLSRAGSDLIKGERVRTYGVRARVGSIEYPPRIDFGLIASAAERIALDVVSFSPPFFLAGKIIWIVIDVRYQNLLRASKLDWKIVGN